MATGLSAPCCSVGDSQGAARLRLSGLDSRAYRRARAPEHVKCDNVMCAVDTPGAVRVIRLAVELAERLHAKLRLVHAVPPVDHTPTTRFEDVFRADIMRIGA